MSEFIPVRAFDDNYIWVLRGGTHAAVVDPGDADPVLEYLAAQNLRLAAVLVTHHHPDHIGGIEELIERHPAPVYGPRAEKIPGRTHGLGGGDHIRIDEIDVAFTVLDIPGHTSGHIAYYGVDSLLCGDTLFACGCGRVFEGTAEQMHASLRRLAALPDATRVYCAHEYTLANIAFARAVEPDNTALAKRESEARALREADRPTLPSTIAYEKETNPFLRCHEPSVATAAARRAGHALPTPVQVFAAVREWKNRF